MDLLAQTYDLANDKGCRRADMARFINNICQSACDNNLILGRALFNQGDRCVAFTAMCCQLIDDFRKVLDPHQEHNGSNA